MSDRWEKDWPENESEYRDYIAKESENYLEKKDEKLRIIPSCSLIYLSLEEWKNFGFLLFEISKIGFSSSFLTEETKADNFASFLKHPS